MASFRSSLLLREGTIGQAPFSAGHGALEPAFALAGLVGIRGGVSGR